MKPEKEEFKIPVHGAEDFSVSEGVKAITKEERVIVKKEDLSPPKNFEQGEVLIIPVVNVKDIRDLKDGEIGALYPDQAKEFEIRMETFFDEVYKNLPENERQDIDIIFLAGETDLITPGEDGIKNPHQRAVETGDVAIVAIKKIMDKYGLNPDKSLTTKNGRPIAITHLNDLKFLHPLGSESEEKYRDFLVKKYGTAGREIWKAFECDDDKEIRESLGAEGPDEIADRTANVMDISSTIADLHQEENPQKRVIIFAFGHYDNLSPWVKKHLVGVEPAKGFVPMEKGGGLVIKRKSDKTTSAILGDKEYTVKHDSLV